MANEDYTKLKLLFVDDDSLIRRFLREILRNSFWRNAEIVESVPAAFEQIKSNTPDLVFTDWAMEGENGLDLIRAIRERPDSPDPLLPVVLLTANGDVAHVLGGRVAGAAGFLVKPISLERITERVIDVVTRPRPFIVSPRYVGANRRSADRPVVGQRRNTGKLPPGTVMLQPDGLLLAKVRGDHVAIREAASRRAQSIATVARILAEQRVEPG